MTSKLDGIIETPERTAERCPTPQRRHYVSPQRTELNVMEETRSGVPFKGAESGASHPVS